MCSWLLVFWLANQSPSHHPQHMFRPRSTYMQMPWRRVPRSFYDVAKYYGVCLEAFEAMQG